MKLIVGKTKQTVKRCGSIYREATLKPSLKCNVFKSKMNMVLGSKCFSKFLSP